MLGEQIGIGGDEFNPDTTPQNLTCALDVPPRPHLHGDMKSSTQVLSGAQLRLPRHMAGAGSAFHLLQPQEAELGARLQVPLLPVVDVSWAVRALCIQRLIPAASRDLSRLQA